MTVWVCSPFKAIKWLQEEAKFFYEVLWRFLSFSKRSLSLYAETQHEKSANHHLLSSTEEETSCRSGMSREWVNEDRSFINWLSLKYLSYCLVHSYSHLCNEGVPVSILVSFTTFLPAQTLSSGAWPCSSGQNHSCSTCTRLFNDVLVCFEVHLLFWKIPGLVFFKNTVLDEFKMFSWWTFHWRWSVSC